MKNVAIIISPNWHDYAKKYLADCLDSLSNQILTGGFKLFLVDNESNNESLEFLKTAIAIRPALAERTQIIQNLNNDGFAKGNNDAMKVALAQGYEYLILFNMDTIIDKNAVHELVRAAESDRAVGAVQARLMLYPEQEKINSLGNVTHFLGFGYSDGYGEKYSTPTTAYKNIFYPSGAAVLYKAEPLKQIGLFDEEFWMYAEDQDLGWRTWLAGYRCVLAPAAIVYHKYEFSRSINKFYWMDRNRIIVMFKNYKLLTLILILPALLIMEIGLLFFAAKGGWLKEKFKVYLYFFNFNNCRYLIKARQNTQKSRKIKDSKLVPLLSSRIDYQEINSPALKFANYIFTLYWQGISKLIIW